MSEPILTCPECRAKIKLTESLAALIIADARRKLQDELVEKTAALSAREAKIEDGRKANDAARRDLEDELARRVGEERKTIAEKERTAARTAAKFDLEQKDAELKEARKIAADRETRLKEAQKAQADFSRRERELEDERRELALTVETQVRAGLDSERDKARRAAEEVLGLKVREKEEQINGMQRQIEELKRRAEQGSQQLQGEAQELQLEEMLRRKFPGDIFDPVPKGEFGGDLLHRVMSPSGQSCGTILWEAKRTKNWSDGWLPKLRDDQRAAHADVALIVSHALPKGVQSFDLMDGVWIAEPKCAMPVAIAIRQTLVQVAGSKLASEGQQTKTTLVYEYLTGPRFRRRVEAIVERFGDMQFDLDRERKAITKSWAKREQQIRAVIEATAGMYGDLQGIAGRSLAEIDGLDILMLDGPGQALLASAADDLA